MNTLILVFFKVIEEKVNLILTSDVVKYVTLMIPEMRQIYLTNTGINVTINIDKKN